jgi:uncharacterized membrane protein
MLDLAKNLWPMFFILGGIFGTVAFCVHAAMPDHMVPNKKLRTAFDILGGCAWFIATLAVISIGIAVYGAALFFGGYEPINTAIVVFAVIIPMITAISVFSMMPKTPKTPSLGASQQEWDAAIQAHRRQRDMAKMVFMCIIMIGFGIIILLIRHP